jgi:hypothetical protein
MSVNGDSTANPTPDYIKQWVYAVQNPTEVKSLVFEFYGSSTGFDTAAEEKFKSAVYNPALAFKLPTSTETKTNSSTKYCQGSATDNRFWCYKYYKQTADGTLAEKPTLKCEPLSGGRTIPAGTKLASNIIALSCQQNCVLPYINCTSTDCDCDDAVSF